MVLLVSVLAFATNAFAVTRTIHTDYIAGSGTNALAQLKVTQCCSNGKPYSYVKVRATVQTTSSATSYEYGPGIGDSTTLEHVSLKSYSDGTKIIGASHACYAKCSYCNSGWGSKSSYHAS